MVKHRLAVFLRFSLALRRTAEKLDALADNLELGPVLPGFIGPAKGQYDEAFAIYRQNWEKPLNGAGMGSAATGCGSKSW